MSARRPPHLPRRALCAGLVSVLAGGCRGERRAQPDVTAATRERAEVDVADSLGRFNRLSGVQGSPLPLVAGDVERTALFRTHHIENARIDQDCSPNTLTLGGIFPDERADPERPESYQFGAIDAHIAAARAAGAAVLWQASYDVGRSDRWAGINLGGRAPRDLARWSRVVTRCLEHFNHRWAGGLDDAVGAVEFPNEPSGLGGFGGTDAKRLVPTFLHFLDTIARYRASHPGTSVRAVGPGIPLSWAEWPTWRPGFDRALASVRASGHSLPVFSFHTYGDDVSPAANARLASELRGLLDSHGMQVTELWNTEWQAGDFLRKSLHVDKQREASSTLEERRRFGAAMATYAIACKLRWQGVLDGAYYYRVNRRAFPPGVPEPFLGEGTFLSSPARSGALALHEGLTQLVWSATPVRCRTTLADDGLLTVQGFRSDDARTVSVLVSNLRQRRASLHVSFANAAASAVVGGQAYTLDERDALTTRAVAPRVDARRVVFEASVAPLTSELLTARLA
jgi:hypothetical protein